MKPKFTNKILIVSVAAIGLYVIFLLISDFSAVYNKITNFKMIYLPVILLLVSCSWFILFLRWTILLKNLEIYIPAKYNFIIFLSSFSLSATPGQFGELIKSQLLKTKLNIPITKTAPLVVIERLYDLTGAIAVSFLGLWFLDTSIFMLSGAAIVLVAIFILIKSQSAFNKTVFLLKRLRFTTKLTDSFSNSFDTIQTSIGSKILCFSIILSIMYWFLMGVAAYFVIIAVGIDSISFFNMISIYSSSTILGAISFIPGGIGVTEGSIAGLLSLTGIDISIVLVLGILIRIFTLWYGVIVGFISLKISSSLTPLP